MDFNKEDFISTEVTWLIEKLKDWRADIDSKSVSALTEAQFRNIRETVKDFAAVLEAIKNLNK